MTCPANASPLQLQFGYPCVLEMTTSDPNVVLDNRINLGGTGINFQSALPITITVQFNCDVQLIYICPADWKTNIDLFSYKIQSLDNSTSESNFISINEQNQCEPNRLQTNISTRKLIIEIVQTKDQQTPRQVVLDILGCYVSPSDRSNVSFSCSRVSILTHSAIELILVDDGTNVTKDLDFDGRGCSFRSLKPMITILFRSNFSTKFSSIGVFSSNVDQIEIDFFNDDENESKSTKIQSSIQRNPLVSNLSSNFDTTTTLSIILLRTDDRLAPRDVRLSIDVCFREFSVRKIFVDKFVFIDFYFRLDAKKHLCRTIAIESSDVSWKYRKIKSCFHFVVVVISIRFFVLKKRFYRRIIIHRIDAFVFVRMVLFFRVRSVLFNTIDQIRLRNKSNKDFLLQQMSLRNIAKVTMLLICSFVRLFV